MAFVSQNAHSIIEAALAEHIAVISVFATFRSDGRHGVLERDVRRGHLPELAGQALRRQADETRRREFHLLRV